jgi:hypothetical protein
MIIEQPNLSILFTLSFYYFEVLDSIEVLLSISSTYNPVILAQEIIKNLNLINQKEPNRRLE